MPRLAIAPVQPVARISLRSLEIVLDVHNMAEPGVNAQYDCVAWSDGDHTTTRRGWRMRVGVIPTPHEVCLADLHKQLHPWGGAAMDNARGSTSIGTPEFRKALAAALLVRDEIDEVARAHWLAELDIKCTVRCKAGE